MINSAKTAKLLLSVLSMVVASSVANATVYGNDPRKQASPDENPIYQRVGVITKAGTDEVLGTAWLSGECQITAMYHSVFFKERAASGKVITSRGKKGFAVDFHIGLKPGKTKSYEQTVRAEVVDFGNYMPGDTSGVFQDYAHLKLASCVGKDRGYLQVKPSTGTFEGPTGELMVVGFHQDRYFSQSGISVETGCKAQDQSVGIGGYSLNCSAMPMCSGCPVLEKQSNGEFLVTGMIKVADPTTAEAYTADNANWMVLSDVFSDSLIKARGEEVAPHILRARVPQSTSVSTKLATAPRAVVR